MRRWMIMGETSYVLAPVNNAEAQLRLSSMIRAMHELGKFALVRHVKKKDGDPKVSSGHELQAATLLTLVPARRAGARCQGPRGRHRA